jgi:hypothetical protein
MTDLLVLQRKRLADLMRTVLDSQSRLDLVLHVADNDFRPSSFLTLAFSRESVCLSGSIASLTSVHGQLFTNCPLAEPGGLRDLVLGSSGFRHACYYLTVCRADAWHLSVIVSLF